MRDGGQATGEPAGIPSPTLSVIGAGFGRTGTLSLREALVRLGFGPCDHMLENFEHPERFALWREAFERKQGGEPIDWRPLLGGYRATVDWPGAYFWKALTAAHPDARVILTVRDPHRWYGSALTTIYGLRARFDDSLRARATMRLLGMVMPALREGLRVADDIIWEGTFGGRFADAAYARRVFIEHNLEVEETVPLDRLLVFDVKQGWEPLCAFLGVPIPDGEPFPHANDAGSFQKLNQERFARSLLKTAAPFAAVAVAAAALVWGARRMHRRRDG